MKIIKDYEEFGFACLICTLCWILIQVFTAMLLILQ